MNIPRYLNAHADLWTRDPHAANLRWFRDAKWGLFIHYGLYSQLGKGEWALYTEKIPLAEYERLAGSFRPDAFDAEAITDLAVEAGMQYVNLVSCHHDGFPLWGSRAELWNSTAVCGRDLVRELGEACDRKGLGFFLYFTHVLNWRHPYAWPRDVLTIGRPDYTVPEPRYKLHAPLGPDGMKEYWRWSHALIDELCSFDFPVAGIWLDIIVGYYHAPQYVPIQETYRRIRARRSEALICFKQGATGDEDYASPEHTFESLGNRMRAQGRPDAGVIADAAWEKNHVKKNEICTTLQKKGWGYVQDTEHCTADEVRGMLAHALTNNCSLLANVGPLADGSIHPEDAATLRACGKAIREKGWPDASENRAHAADGAPGQ
ncbi:MAG: alpha-L-fucosidase [Spirochaetes bacterium]|nr:alpha-L-fucosidase [Spirochaetota bacterium]